MDRTSFRNKIGFSPTKRSISYIKQYNDFWSWKIGVEQHNCDHILDTKHIDETHKRLIDILPRWQTYRGVNCNYKSDLPLALKTISDAYNRIRKYSLLDFQQIPDEPLHFIWDILGRIKEKNGSARSNSDYFVISVCKPLMFLWGQTLAFDSINRINIQKDKSLELTQPHIYESRWPYLFWKTVMQDLQREMLKSQGVVDYSMSHSYENYGTNLTVPFGRYLDLYYYY
ncbi:hypothetical protein ACFLWF_01625 [Chloroflexota bacterium]